MPSKCSTTNLTLSLINFHLAKREFIHTQHNLYTSPNSTDYKHLDYLRAEKAFGTVCDFYVIYDILLN